jgi:hypothetical protein
MSRQLENLKRVFEKLQSRYGVGDPIVSQFQQEVESRESVESHIQQLSAAHLRGLPGGAALRRREVTSRYPSELTDLH